ncbi:hypothetical protein BVG80_16170, partial [Sphingobacteriales bacterium TSM_CSM]
MGQTPPEIDFCGFIEKPPLENGQTAKFYDRFGNAYTEEELMPAYHPLALRGNCDSGYFAVYFEGADWTTDEQATICQVFADLSELILSENDLPVDILLRKMTLQAGVAGTGTPFWEAECGMANSQILDLLNNAYIESYPVGYFLAEIQISNDVDWHTLADDLPTDDFANPTIAAGYLDLYSITLHEALHTLGFASRISVNGAPLPDGNFYSRWDRFIFSVPKDIYLLEHAATSDCCSEYAFNDDVDEFPDMPNNLAFGCDLQLAFKNTNGVIIAPVNVGAYTTFTGDNGPAFFLNKLSHLDFDCTTNLGLSPALKYVMHPGFNYAEARRIVTVEEQQILCALGYHLNTEENCQQNCEVFTNPDSYQIFLQGPAINNPLTIPLSGINGILANDLTPEDVTVTIETNCSFIGDLEVDFDGTEITLTAISTGIFHFCYTVVSCDGICQTETVTVNVNNEPVETQCDDPYCNIVCFGDFEGFVPAVYSIYGELNVPPIQFSEAPSSPSVENYDGNNVLTPGIGTGFDWDAIPIPLSQSIPVDCEVQISFNATALHMYFMGDDLTLQPTLQFTALSDYPCASFPFPNCTPGQFSLCGGTITAANMTPSPCGLPVDFQAVPAAGITSAINAIDFNNLPNYIFSWTNTTGQPVTNLLLNANVSVGDISNAGAVMTFLDNLIVTLECEEHISIESADLDEVCPGSMVSIPYTICLENPETEPLPPVNVFLDANTEALPGVSVIPGGIFNALGQANVAFDPNTNLCTTAYLNLSIGTAFTAGQEININMEAFNSGAGDFCISGNSSGLNTVLTIIDCGDPPPSPYNCLDMLNFFTVNAGTPNAFILSEFDTDRNSYSPPTSQTWQPGSHPFTAITGSSTDLSFNVDLVIPAGIELAINDMNLFFAPDKRILVQPGGSLSIENTVIDGVCEVMWTGVQVQGPGMNISPNSNNAGK